MWLARNQDNRLIAFANKPIKFIRNNKTCFKGNVLTAKANRDLFPNLDYSNSPLLVTDKEVNKEIARVREKEATKIFYDNFEMW